ncbi:hypothetical protein VSDG_02748 [Cytospora chrysosperma]|uniref:protein-tyrosine-phosphatase n=1 Tax=Cytospora chrysosperma TaxID=252740 RepID=A0A423WCH7_CYTCH|nr:hypothetical protein VSDG_02748 [Valsa sordida]
MELYAFTCNFCGAACPVDCFPTHKDSFICHNAVCFAHAPSDLNEFSPIGEKCLAAASVSLLPAHTDVLNHTLFRDIASTRQPREETREEDHEERISDGEEAIAHSEATSHAQKVRKLATTLQALPRPTALDYLFDISCVPSISEIVPGLFLGNMACVDNETVLKSYKINAVISVISPRRVPFPRTRAPDGGAGLHPLEKLFPNKDRMVIVAHDRRSEDLIQHFEGACNFIYRHRHPVTASTVAISDTDGRNEQEKVDLPTSSTDNEENIPRSGRVLIHCTQGISRSATIVAAYLMWRKRESAARILTFIKNKRPNINPNEGFLDQLLVWQEVGYDVWDNKQFRVPCFEYMQLQGRLLEYGDLEKRKRRARRDLAAKAGEIKAVEVPELAVPPVSNP